MRAFWQFDSMFFANGLVVMTKIQIYFPTRFAADRLHL